ARMAFQPASQTQQLAAVRQQLDALSRQKEQLERQLADAVPGFRAKLIADEPPPHTRLAEQLPAKTAYIDFLQFRYVPPGATGLQPSSPRLKEIAERTVCYAAFLLLAGNQAKRIDLGPAQPIDEAIDRWRREIVAGRAGTAGFELRNLLWQPIEEQLSGGVETIYLVPDGRLSSVPWAALPGKARGTVLLEQFAIALVPHGQFLLQRLTPYQPAADLSRVLAVGNPDFGASGDASRDNWPRLPGTQQELGEIAAFAGGRATVISGTDATTDRVLRELPRASLAHLATHGFFADAELRSFLQLDAETFAERDRGVGLRTSVVERNPLLLSGLALAGANQSNGDEMPQAPSGILTAETIAGLPLDKLYLAVLSACDTGLGDVAGGEGVFGLQRAFHQAGAQNVVASLWKVNDESTAALMRLFYYNLWEEKLPPLEALRRAQITLYRGPDQINALATTTRGPNFNKVVKLVEGRAVRENPERSPPRVWAAFVLSGPGR
ncbi:MAG TPA: CHAT domain-containing protein, partial [Pirellulaceae bacterium]|nr:CHAT domain-containing protein [Pirellulaceae bacterium]